MKLSYISPALLIAAAALLAACDDTPQVENSRPDTPDTPVNPERPTVTDYYVSPTSSGCVMSVSHCDAAGAEAFIGHGIDITRPYLDPAATRATVVDISKLSASQISDFEAPASNAGNSFHGADAEEFLGNLMANMGVKPDGSHYFAATLQNAAASSSFLMQIQSQRQRIMSVNAPNLSEYTTSGFRTDLQRLSATGIVEKYGTHIIIRAVTGVAVKYIYSAYLPVSGRDYSQLLNDGYDAAKESAFGRLNASLPEKLAAIYNYGAQLDVAFLGGNTSLIDFNSEKGVIGDISAWQDSGNHSNSALIELADSDILPLSAAISDAGVAAEVDKAADAYIKNSGSDLQELTPLFQNTNGTIYRYVTSALESSTLDKSGIYSYGVLGALSAVPTTEASKPLYSNVDDAGNQILSLIQPSPDWQKLGYVMAERSDDCVPLYEISDGTRYAYTIEAANSLGSKRQWHPTGVVFYLLRP